MSSFKLFDRMDGADVGMVQRGGGARLALKAFDQLAVLRHFRWKKLQGHASAELGILGFVHHAHSAGAKLLEDAVMRKSLSSQRSGFGH